MAKLRRVIRHFYAASLRSQGLRGRRGRRIAFRRASGSVHFLARDSLEKLDKLISSWTPIVPLHIERKQWLEEYRASQMADYADSLIMEA